MNYTNQLSAERQYLLSEAFPDWKHKLCAIRLDRHLDQPFLTLQGRQTTIRDWFTELQDTVMGWTQEGRMLEIPDFEETVSEFTSRAVTPRSVDFGDGDVRVFGMGEYIGGGGNGVADKAQMHRDAMDAHFRV
jgi:hypothetical protein